MELEPFKLSLVNSVDSMLRFLDDVGLPNVRANCDISHLHLVARAAEEVQRLKGKDRPRPPQRLRRQGPRRPAARPRRDADQGLPAAIRDTGFDRTVSIELEYSPEPDRIVEWVEEAYQETDKIMRELNCRG